MARPGITYQQVASTAEALAARGETPSIQRIRQELGSGSHTTIHEHLKRWQQQLADNPRAVLPPALPQELLPAVEQFWRSAVDRADESYRQRRDELEARMEQTQADRQMALAERDRFQEEIAELHQEQETLRRTLLERERELRREREGRLAAESALEEAHRGQQAAERQAERVVQEFQARERRLEQTLETIKQDAQQRLQYERERHEAEEARLMRDWDRLRGELTGRQRELDTLREQGRTREAALLEQLNVSQRERAAVLGQQTALEERLKVLTQELALAREGRDALEREHRSTLRQLESLRGKLVRTGARRKALERQLAAKEAATAGQDNGDNP